MGLVAPRHLCQVPGGSVWVSQPRHSFVYILPRSLKSIYTAWQFSGQILFKCKTNRDLKIFPSVSDRIPAVCCSLPSNKNKMSDLSPFTVHRVSSGCWLTGCALLLYFLYWWDFHLLHNLRVPHCFFMLIAALLFKPLVVFLLLPLTHFWFIFAVSPFSYQSTVLSRLPSQALPWVLSALNLLETGDRSLLFPKACGVKVPAPGTGVWGRA